MSSIDINLVADALKKHTVINKNVAKADFARAISTSLDKYCRKVTKIKGSYHVLYSIMSHVVQGFKTEWKELGQYVVKSKELKNYRQKINFGIIPADVLSTFLADWYEEDKKPTDKEITKKIVEWLLIQVQDDLETLSIKGVHDESKAHGAFGYSMDGLETICMKAFENNDNPVYKIPSEAITDDNIIDILLNFERQFPKRLRGKIKRIHTSSNNIERYGIAYHEKYGVHPTYKDSDLILSPLRMARRNLIGHDGLRDDILFATVEGNLLNLIDVIDNPTKFTDVQVADYKVKLFMEFSKGYDFLINEAVCMADVSGDVLGLGDEKKMKLYYPSEVEITSTS